MKDHVSLVITVSVKFVLYECVTEMQFVSIFRQELNILLL